MLLSDDQLFEIQQVILDHHNAFVANVIGTTALAKDVLDRLEAKGLLKPGRSTIEEAYLYGQVLAILESPEAAKMDYAALRRYVAKNPIPLTEIERGAIAYAQHQAAQYARGLGNRVDLATGQVIIEADAALRARTREQIRDATALNIAKRQTIKQLKSELGWLAKDWARDWDRIATTEKHGAMQRGTADYYAEHYGPDVLVFKRPMPDACKYCNRLHLDANGLPRIYRLSALEENGSNVGRRAADWLPTVGPVHPFCLCSLQRVPDGWGFDAEGTLVPGGKARVSKSTRAGDLIKSHKLQGTRNVQGLEVAIENRAGTYRYWADSEGNEGKTLMEFDYGYVKRTIGSDMDQVDVFVGPDPASDVVTIVHQQSPATGVYDEDKAMVGWPDTESAVRAYRDHYDKPDSYLVTYSEMDIEGFQRWLAGQRTDSEHIARPRFVLPLRKATADNRAPGEGTAVNQVMNSPRAGVTVTVVDLEEDEEEIKRRNAHARRANTLDKDRLTREVNPFEPRTIADRSVDSEARTDQTNRNREMLEERQHGDKSEKTNLRADQKKAGRKRRRGTD